MKHKTRRTRAKTGWVLGQDPEWVAEKLLDASEILMSPTNDSRSERLGGGSWTRAEARIVLTEVGVNKENADAMVHALCRVPGVKRIGHGLYASPHSMGRALRHRTWRIAPRRLDMADAEDLLDLLEIYEEEASYPSPGLVSLLNQLARALEGLQ